MCASLCHHIQVDQQQLTALLRELSEQQDTLQRQRASLEAAQAHALLVHAQRHIAAGTQLASYTAYIPSLPGRIARAWQAYKASPARALRHAAATVITAAYRAWAARRHCARRRVVINPLRAALRDLNAQAMQAALGHAIQQGALHPAERAVWEGRLAACGRAMDQLQTACAHGTAADVAQRAAACAALGVGEARIDACTVTLQQRAEMAWSKLHTAADGACCRHQGPLLH